jgi:hypothetical protein
LVSNIGETLDINRFECENDLPKMVVEYKYFMANKSDYKTKDKRCKIQPIRKFVDSETWIIDKWWNDEERGLLGVDELKSISTIENLETAINESEKKLTALSLELGKIPIAKKNGIVFKSKTIDDLFTTEKGEGKYTRKYIQKHSGAYPLYSSKTEGEGIIGYIDKFDHDKECITWTTDGINAGQLFLRNGKFSMTAHCGSLTPKSDDLYIPYFKYKLQLIIKSKTRGSLNKRVTERMIKRLTLEVPIKMKDGKEIYDTDMQKEIASRYEQYEKLKLELHAQLDKLKEISSNVYL